MTLSDLGVRTSTRAGTDVSHAPTTNSLGLRALGDKLSKEKNTMRSDQKQTLSLSTPGSRPLTGEHKSVSRPVAMGLAGSLEREVRRIFPAPPLPEDCC